MRVLSLPAPRHESRHLLGLVCPRSKCCKASTGVAQWDRSAIGVCSRTGLAFTVRCAVVRSLMKRMHGETARAKGTVGPDEPWWLEACWRRI
jgi:hypothetical protein